MHHYRTRILEHVVPCQHIRTYPRATTGEQEELRLAVKQYTPLCNPNPKPGDVTIIGTHGNAFPKAKLYEPLWEDMLQHAQKAGFSIRNIWIVNMAHQGASRVLNQGNLGNDPSWFDHARDLNQMVNYFRREMVRPIVGIGHSVGGHSLINLSLYHPRLLEALVLIEPGVFSKANIPGNYLPAAISSRRREMWPSRAAAAEAFVKKDFYQRWDSRVLDLWVKHGLRNVSPSQGLDTEVTLTTTKHQEVFFYVWPTFDAISGRYYKRVADAYPASKFPNDAFYRPEPIVMFRMLPSLFPSVLYGFGEKSDFFTPEMRAENLMVTSTGASCLVPMEVVGETAKQSARWLGGRIHEWQRDESAERDAWDALPNDEKCKISRKFVDALANSQKP
ncbi:hypothetical protein K469DRAFT_723412 [Zopfia rhizophila CBS 207.26]|uniref:Serine aminopeptidase S33 domain-containing protein n=1 Tax=Zopfia rhizophila CBS 207.26 TaxID=1314779 RepID=A0A6A6D933_9PEZI|nr:hypothetical protein K469DRAFT_723412 [Zopfia rhizophila CBS 207.26]